MKTAGYSGTPLARKLGIKENSVVRIINMPQHYFRLFSDWPERVTICKDGKEQKDLIHYFVTEAAVLYKELPLLKKELKPSGMIWVSWYKKSAKMPTDITEDTIRNYALEIGLVDVKVCAVDELWSGLKLVVPLKER